MSLTRTHAKVLVALALLAIAGLIAWRALPHPPSFDPYGIWQGRPVTEWEARVERAVAERDPGIVDELAALGPQGAPLLAWLGRTNSSTAMTMTHEAVERIGTPIVPELIELAEQPKDTLRRLWAVKALGVLGEDALRAAPHLTRLLADAARRRDAELLEALRWALGEMGPPAIAHIEPLLADDTTREHALRILRSYSLAALPALDEAARVPGSGANPALQAAAVVRTEEGAIIPAVPAAGDITIVEDRRRGERVLRQTGMRQELARNLQIHNLTVDDAIRRLNDYLAGDDGPRRRQAAEAARHFGMLARPLAPQLIGALSAPDPRLRWEAALALGSMPIEALPATQCLLDIARDNADTTGRNCALWALGEIGPDAPDAFPVAASLFHDMRWDHFGIDNRHERRLLAAHTMARTRPADAAPLLVNALDEPQWFVRHGFVNALALCGPDALAPLRNALDDPRPRVRHAAAIALLKMGDRLTLAYVALAQPTAHREDPFLQWAAQEAARQLARLHR
ncbi:MAG: HEAT repeat domain-containing protein [Candidatus Sumerlaeia bacterium]|nr:HEAT repeat domain-containing protein [Candidatus Sumerlaeia bacterium]